MTRRRDEALALGQRRTDPRTDPEVERKALELERAARDLEHPQPLAQSFPQQLTDEADDMREGARRLREAGAQQTDLMETSFAKASRLLENIGVEWRKTDSNLMVNVTNKNHDVVSDFELWVEEPVRKSGSAFAKQKEFQDYQPLRLVGGSNRLYHDQPESFPFLSYAIERLYFTGHGPDNPSGQGNFRTLGVWKVTFRSVVDGMSRKHELFFNWDNLRKIYPTPCDSEGNALG